MPLTTKTALFSLILVIGVVETVLAILNARVVGSLVVFSAIGAGWGIITSIWISFLLYYNSRPTSSVFSTRSSTHCMSLIVLSVVWFALSALHGRQIAIACSPSGESNYYNTNSVTCGLGAGTFGGAFVLLILCISAAVAVYRSASQSDLGTGVTVEQHKSKFQDDASLRTLVP